MDEASLAFSNAPVYFLTYKRYSHVEMFTILNLSFLNLFAHYVARTLFPLTPKIWLAAKNPKPF